MAGDAFENKDYATAAALYARLSANAVRAADRQRGYYFEALCQHYRGREREALASYKKSSPILKPPVALTFTSAAVPWVPSY